MYIDTVVRGSASVHVVFTPLPSPGSAELSGLDSLDQHQHHPESEQALPALRVIIKTHV